MVALLALGGELLLVGQQAPVPEIPFEVTEPLELPDDLYFGEIAGVALNSERHVFVYTRTGGSGASILQGERAQLFEFGPDGRFVREIGRNLYSKAWAHAVRVERGERKVAGRQGRQQPPVPRPREGKRSRAPCQQDRARRHQTAHAVVVEPGKPGGEGHRKRLSGG